MHNCCLEDITSNYMNRKNLIEHYKRIEDIRNRKNNFLPKIVSQRNIVKSPKRRMEAQKIEEDNLKIFRSLLSIDYRFPVLSEKKSLNRRYLKKINSERNEYNNLQIKIIDHSRKKNLKKLLLSPINLKKILIKLNYIILILYNKMKRS